MIRKVLFYIFLTLASGFSCMTVCVVECENIWAYVGITLITVGLWFIVCRFFPKEFSRFLDK